MTVCIQSILLLLAANLIAADAPKQDSTKKDIERIQGTWKLVSLEADGDQGPPEIVAKLKLVFKGEALTFTPGEPGFSNYTFKLDTSAKPPRFDMTFAEGPNKGKKLPGIYSLEGESLKICFGPADQHPKELTAKAKSGQVMYVLKREKP